MPRITAELIAPSVLEDTAVEGDVVVDISTPVVLALPAIDTNGTPPLDCRLPFPLLRLIPSPSPFFWCSFKAPKLFADRSDISLGGPVTDAKDIFSSSNSTAPSVDKIKRNYDIFMAKSIMKEKSSAHWR